MLFATSDGALFRRDEFIRVALAPLVVISTMGGDDHAVSAVRAWPIGLALAVVLNAGGAIGDLWMTTIVLRYGPSALIRDEEDSMRIFAQAVSQV